MSTHLKASNMVAQEKPLKTSSNRKSTRAECEIKTILTYDWLLPKDVELKVNPNSYAITGTLGSERVDPTRWAWPPHRALANLPITTSPETGLAPRVDPMAARKFILNYGVVTGMLFDQSAVERLNKQYAALTGKASTATLEIGGVTDFTNPYFVVSDAELAEAQFVLRAAWEGGNDDALTKIQQQGPLSSGAGVRVIDVSIGSAGIQLVAKNLWTVICLLFLQDYATGKTGKCANPECAVPYFLKKRSTQKFCETGECVIWAQRRYALNWWHSRPKKAKKSTRRQKK